MAREAKLVGFVLLLIAMCCEIAMGVTMGYMLILML